MKLLVTGGCGFIGSALVRHLINHTDWQLTNLDALTYAANHLNVAEVASNPRYKFIHADISTADLAEIFASEQPDGIIHLAAESHVDRSIENPAPFIASNITGTFRLLEAARRYFATLTPAAQQAFRFHHVSTDEVYGALTPAAPPFTESTAFDPHSPYAASKAAADHLLTAWHRTYGLPVVRSHGSNTYGPFQYPEKLIPAALVRALSGRPVELHGTGSAVRDWLHVDDHVTGLLAVFTRGKVGHSYNLGGGTELTNLAVAKAVTTLLDTLAPQAQPYGTLITHVPERPGQDPRYALNTAKAHTELGWQPQISFENGLRRTAEWFLANRGWWQALA